MDQPFFDTIEPGPDAEEHFRKFGWVLTEPLRPEAVAELRSWVDDLMMWPDDGPWLHYREATANGPRLCRTENFVPFHDELRELLTRSELSDTASILLDETAVLYKEKINYKAPGGAGYSAHQDAPAYRFIETHVSCMLAIDDSRESNGCLEVVSSMHNEVLPMDDKGCIRADIVEQLDWTPAPIWAGQALWFHSRTPHRSGPNTSNEPRRALYPTYNALREGDLRAAYYEQKAAEFAASDGPRVSLIGDFEGQMI